MFDSGTMPKWCVRKCVPEIRGPTDDRLDPFPLFDDTLLFHVGLQLRLDMATTMVVNPCKLGDKPHNYD